MGANRKLFHGQTFHMREDSTFWWFQAKSVLTTEGALHAWVLLETFRAKAAVTRLML